MAQTPSPPPSPPLSPPQLTPPSVSNPTKYWCYQCNKRVLTQTLPDQPDIICIECNNSFLELKPAHHPHFLHFLRLISIAMHDNDHNDHNANEPQGDENHNEVVRVHDEQEIIEDEDIRLRQRRNVIGIQLRGMAARAHNRGHMVLDAADILRGIENRTIKISFQVPGYQVSYITNPGDYVNAPGFEALFENLVEVYGSGTRGAPPAARSVINRLPSVEVELNDVEVCCVICKDRMVNNEVQGEGESVKQLPCGHMYHEGCIVPWLGWRNTCPVCRYELDTDDREYEEERKKRSNDMGMTSSGDRTEMD